MPARPWQVEPIAPLNTNYTPPRPWTCLGGERGPSKDCDGTVVGKVAAYPVCATCAPIAVAQLDASTAERAAWAEAYFATPAGRAELAAEQAWEARVS